MNKIKIPSDYNYISAFLTFACTFKCDYCINHYNGLHKYKHMSTEDWVLGLNRIQTKKNCPITLTGGEPTLCRGFYDIVDGIDKKINCDLLTNGDFDIRDFVKNIPPERMKRRSKYASIRFSYHPGYSDGQSLIWDVHTLDDAGYHVGIWGVDTGDEVVKDMQKEAKKLGIDFRLKEFLDSTHGNYKYPKGVDGKRKKCLCKPSELLIAPDGRLFRCHYDLYHGVNSYAHILDEQITLPTDFLHCDNYGLCNPCDIKLKFDRHQRTGWCSVSIKDVDKM